MKKRQFVLTQEQETQLKNAYLDSKNANLSQKFFAVRMYGTGRTTVEVKTLLDCSRTSLMEWVQRYRQQELAGLIDQRQGGNHFKLIVEA
jgi:transposase